MTPGSNSLTNPAAFALQIKDERWTALDADWDETIQRVLPLLFEAVSSDAGGRAATQATARGEVCLVFTNDAEVEALNKAWRGKDGPTNVLSFPGGDGEGSGADGTSSEDRVLGDVVLALETITREAVEQGKSFRNHAVHLLVHGVLHLLGYDHQMDKEAGHMEDLERKVLAGLNVGDPYAAKTCASMSAPGLNDS